MPLRSETGTAGEGDEEQRLRAALRHLQAEAGVLERLVYKHRNQHRGAAYFQYLLKVRPGRSSTALHLLMKPPIPLSEWRVSMRAGEEGPQASARRRPRGGPQRRVPSSRMPQAGQHDPRPQQVSLLFYLRLLQISLALISDYLNVQCLVFYIFS
jgi:hypothetical protein